MLLILYITCYVVPPCSFSSVLAALLCKRTNTGLNGVLFRLSCCCLLVQVLWSAHVVSGVWSAKVAEQQQRSTTVPFIKGFLFGLLGVFEQIEWEQYVAPKLADKKKSQ